MTMLKIGGRVAELNDYYSISGREDTIRVAIEAKTQIEKATVRLNSRSIAADLNAADWKAVAKDLERAARRARWCAALAKASAPASPAALPEHGGDSSLSATPPRALEPSALRLGGFRRSGLQEPQGGLGASGAVDGHPPRAKLAGRALSAQTGA